MSDEILDNLEIEGNDRLEPSELTKFKTLKIAVLVQVVAAIAATALAWSEIESIVGTGIIGSIIGIIVFVYAQKLSDKQPLLGKFVLGQFIGFRQTGMIIGLSAPIFSLCCFLIIFSCNWSPQQAEVPITSAIGIYASALFFSVAILSGSHTLSRKNQS